MADVQYLVCLLSINLECVITLSDKKLVPSTLTVSINGPLSNSMSNKQHVTLSICNFQKQLNQSIALARRRS